ncbi:MAG: endonuclease/exonuclease/phosphatase family protein [Acidobacteria bacterium]|nr:endonuclease/exonuclease/phosphatase family protein [Acidobacteriota bacterium]
MKARTNSLRVVTYNIHKCRGLDRRVRPGRIVDVLGKIDADIIALQEVLSIENGKKQADQARFIAEELGFYSAFGHNCRMKGGRYGNLLLTRFPIHVSRNYNISFRKQVIREPRGCLRADVRLDATMLLHIFNLHLGTGYFERRHQAHCLLQDRILDHHDVRGPRIVLGDLNEWTRGSASRILNALFEAADVRQHLKRSRTYPGFLPIFHLDHIYFDPVLKLEKLTLCRDRLALIASDHLPLIADFRMELPPAAMN